MRRLVDEGSHITQIIKFTEGIWEINPELTTIPGYHFAQAVISKITGMYSDAYFRLVNVIISFCCIVVFYLSTKGQSERNRIIYTAIFSTFPLYYPFFYLVYTDTFALLFILLLYLFHKKTYYLLAGICLILACLVRQNNIVWGIYFVTLTIYEQYKDGKSYGKIAISLSTYVLCFVLFAIFYKLNDGVAIGDKWAHPAMKFQSENIYYFLFTFFLLCLPYAIEGLLKVKTLSLRQAIILGLIISGAIGLYWATYKGDHPYNKYFPDVFIRNGFIQYFNQDLVHQWLFLGTAIVAIVALYNYTLGDFSKIMLLLTIVLCLLPSWMIETRYYFIPFTLFLLMDKNESKITQGCQLILNLAIVYYLSIKVPADLLFP